MIKKFIISFLFILSVILSQEPIFSFQGLDDNILILNEDFIPSINVNIVEDYLLDENYIEEDYDVTYSLYNPVQDSLFNVSISNSLLEINFTSLFNQFTQNDITVTIKATNLIDGLEYDNFIYVNVNPINDAPVLDEIGDLDFDEDIPYLFNVNAVDVDEDDLTYLCNTITPNIICEVNGTEIALSAPEHYNGSESIEIIVTDGFGGQDSEIVDITINPINDAPTVVDSAESTDEDTQVTISFNGDDVDGDDLTYTILEQTQNGLIVNNNDGTATYTPNAEFNGEDSFTYIANDGFLDSEEPPAVVTITINPINDAPVLDEIGDLDFDEDIPYLFNVNAVDVDEDDLTYLCNTITPNIICEVNGTEIALSAPEHYNGSESIEIIVTDGFGGQDSEIVDITINPINDAPVLDEIGDLDFDEDIPYSFNVNVVDVDEDDLTYLCNTITPNIICEVNGTEIALSAPEHYNGSESIEIIVTDGFGGQDSETVDITINPINDAPVLDEIGDLDFDEDIPYLFNVNAVDVDEDDLTYLCNTITPNIICEVNGTEIALSATEHYNGSESIEIIVTDGFGGQDSETVDITINPINDAPVLDEIGDLDFDEDIPYLFNVNAVDVDEDDLTYLCNTITPNIICEVNGTEIIVTDGFGNRIIRTRTL